MVVGPQVFMFNYKFAWCHDLRGINFSLIKNLFKNYLDIFQINRESLPGVDSVFIGKINLCMITSMDHYILLAKAFDTENFNEFGQPNRGDCQGLY